MNISYENIDEMLESITEGEALMFDELNPHLLAIGEIMSKYDTNYKNFICIEGKDWETHRSMFQWEMSVVDFLYYMKQHISDNLN